MKTNLLEENHTYWNHRAASYSLVNREELEGIQHMTWSEHLAQEIRQQFPGRHPSEIRVLDIGAGPGFISILLAELGYHVVAADYSEEMLRCARENAGELRQKIRFRRENAMDLSFAADSFDVVFSRNLIWNLPDPLKAYREWLRVLKPQGLLLAFDANWYDYLCDEESRRGYEQDRKNVAFSGYADFNIGDKFEIMEEIAQLLPMTGEKRPLWDQRVLRQLGAERVSAVENVGSRLYSEKEKLNYSSTPMFMVRAIK